ncbi:hypothetical protein A6E10_09025 [Aliivibrio fischeri]|nr:hypothetical protein A6E10_09025 [Aliivibrio fischeri]
MRLIMYFCLFSILMFFVIFVIFVIFVNHEVDEDLTMKYRTNTMIEKNKRFYDKINYKYVQ